MMMKPLMGPGVAEYSQGTIGGPYLYIETNSVFFNLVSLSFFYDFTHLRYISVDFDENLEWYTPEQTVDTNSFKMELSLLASISAVTAQIGVGFALDSIILNNNEAINRNHWYFIFAIKPKKNI
jgi:hypothetical protein